ncbi:glycosyltransferase family 9 protein [Hydrogenivirga sp. 128-5-R1-1]|uniref:glycosyltransferase family 9 protein n=1 Tax=Hydrogenivirga sp. 128-5-R1-1 TaxID=392423 RepID=UPI00015F0A99|nr:glycosyltransferase family 9 protein [Hydrogenivirga sp. 128-5-R1-1]EDP74448.1 ADP-heptose:LPS heptosyltransferase [Hydrogenivirga sp. 128-5-R1-1]
MNFLVWQTAYLGDVILATPLIRTIQKNFPEARVSFVGRPFIRELFKGWGVELMPFSKGFKESFSILGRLRGFDVAVVPHRSLRTALIMLFSRIPVRVGFDRSEFSGAYTHVVEHRWELHEVDRNLELLRPLGVKEFVRETYLPLEEEELHASLERFGLSHKGYVVINPFSNFPLKEWSLDNWAHLIGSLKDTEVVVTGLSSDTEKAKVLGGKASFVNLVGRTSLRELMSLIKGSRLVISNDSSPVHIANALGVPAVSVYTATSSRYGFYPLMGSYLDNPAPCSPCSPNPKRCKTGTYECLSLPSPEAVLELVKELL